MRRGALILLLLAACGPPPRAQPAPAAAAAGGLALGKSEGRFEVAGCEVESLDVGDEHPLAPTMETRASYRSRVAPLGGRVARWARWRGVQYDVKAAPLFYLGVFVPAERLLVAAYCHDPAAVDAVVGALEGAHFSFAPGPELPAAELPRGPAAFVPVPRTCTWTVAPDSAGARASLFVSAENGDRWLRRAAIELERTDVPGGAHERHDPDDRPWAVAVEPGTYAVLVTSDFAAALCEPIDVAAGQILDVHAVLDMP